MPACGSETIQWSPDLERARAGSSSSSSSSTSSDSSNPCQPGSPAHWTPSPQPLLSRMVGWYPALVLRLVRQMLSLAVWLLWNQIFVSAGLWLLDCVLHVPLSMAKMVLSVLYGSRGLGRTVLLTGSSIETLQLARNFYQSGTRVVVLEHDDKFGVVRFSTAVDKFYSVPSPQKTPQDYIREVCQIAERENAAYYVPSCTSHPAHFDALTRPYLEKLGVKCACPVARDVWLMDDPAAMLQLCHAAGLATPVNFRITTTEQLASLYEEGQLRRARHVLFNCGPVAARETQSELELPQTRRGFRRLMQTQPKSLMNLSAARPALVVQVPEGEWLVTCTTVREGRMVANVTCCAPLPDEPNPVLEHVHRDDVEQWLERVLAALPPSKTFTGHVSFTLIATRNGIVPVRSRIGVTLPYLCYTRLQPRVLMRPCKHQHQQSPISPQALVLKHGRYWLHDSLLHTLRSPSVWNTFNMVRSLLIKHEALFLSWDPLPCLVFYCLVVPTRMMMHLLCRSRRPSSQLSVHFSTPVSTKLTETCHNGVFLTKNGLVSRVSNGHDVCNGHTSTPYHNGHVPTSQCHKHFSNGHTPLNGHVPLSNGHVPSSNGHVPSSNGHVPSSNGHVPSSNGHVPSSNGHVPLSNGHTRNGLALNGDLIQL